jgi:hypothetical protein
MGPPEGSEPGRRVDRFPFFGGAFTISFASVRNRFLPRTIVLVLVNTNGWVPLNDMGKPPFQESKDARCGN